MTTKVKIIIATEDGKVLDQFEAAPTVRQPATSPGILAQEVRSVIEHHFEVEEDE
jgi:hypothetical protein